MGALNLLPTHVACVVLRKAMPTFNMNPCSNSKCVQMLTQPSQCYLVLLIATAGLTFRAKAPLPLQGSRQPTDLDPAQPPSTPALGPSQQPTALVSLCMLGYRHTVLLGCMHAVES